MFDFFRSKQADPKELVRVILGNSQDATQFASCMDAFSFHTQDRERVIFSIVLFNYFCSRHWACIQKSQKVFDACFNVATVAPRFFRDFDKSVRIGDYIKSSHELALLPFKLETECNLRIPMPPDIEPKNFMPANLFTVANYQIHFNTLVDTILSLRYEQFLRDFKTTSDSNNIHITFMLLAANFYEQVTGTTLTDVSTNPQLATDYQMMKLRGAHSLAQYFQSITSKLNSLK